MSQTVGKVSDVPAGGVVLMEVEGKPVAVANVEGRLFAFDDLCTHRGCSLSGNGKLDGTSITCLCHSSVFQVNDGSVTSGPARRPLQTYPVQVVDGAISISMGSEPPVDSRAASPESAPSPSSSAPADSTRASASSGGASPAEKEHLRAALGSVPLFADLDAASLDGLVAFTFRKRFGPGELIVEEGHTGNGLYVVLSGSVEVVRGLGSARPQRVAVLGPGEPFGEMALLGDWKRSASVRAIDEVECMGMDRWAFLAHLKSEPNLTIRMLQMLADRLSSTNAKLAE